MINILYTKFSEPLASQTINSYLNHLPISIQEKYDKYYRWQDKHSFLFGKLLLLTGLRKFGYSNNSLNEIKYNQYSRPFIDDNVDFNISHSGEYVLCAIGKNLRLGIDIEEIREINFNDFKQVMTSKQWQEIMHSSDTLLAFFKYWTIKESTFKADGRGLSIPLMDVHVKDKIVFCDNRTWFLNELNINDRYSAFLSTDIQVKHFNIKYINFSNIAEWSIC